MVYYVFNKIPYHQPLDYGPDRRGWRDKSDAAIRRENQAKYLFDNFLASIPEDATFPLTEEVIPPKVHLTSACYTSFRKYVTSKGCTAKRRQASDAELGILSTKDRRSGKMYAVSITVPVPLNQAVAAMKEKERKAVVAAAMREAKKREAQRKEKGNLEFSAQCIKEYDEQVEEEYARIVALVDMASGISKIKENVPPKKRKNAELNAESSPPEKKGRILGAITVSRRAVLAHAEYRFGGSLGEIDAQNTKEKHNEKVLLLKQLDEKYAQRYAAAEQQAKERYERIKQAILDAGQQ